MRTALLVGVWVMSAVAAGQDPAVARIAAPGLRPAGLSEEAARRISDAFAEELEHEALEVTTPREIQELLGAERQRQLLSCEQQSSSCLADLTSALQVQAVVTGTVARIGSRLHANVKLLSQGGQVYGVFARSGRTEQDLIVALADAAPAAAADVYKGLGRAVPVMARSRRPVKIPPNLVTYYFAGFLLGAYGFEYERALSERFSLTATAVIVAGDLTDEGERVRELGADFLLGGRVYLLGQVGSGLFAGAELQVGYGVTNVERTGTAPLTRSGVLFAPGVLVGYAFTFPFGVTASAGLGAYWHLTPYAFSGSYGERLHFLPRLNLGYAF